MCIELDLKNIFFVIDGSDNVFARMVASALFRFYKQDGAAVVYSSTETGVCCNIHDIVPGYYFCHFLPLLEVCQLCWILQCFGLMILSLWQT